MKQGRVTMRKPSLVRAASSGNAPEFFKVFVPSFSSRQLELPPAFLNHFNCKLKSKVILKDQTGKSWQVDFKELNEEYFFVNGWKAFADDHRLEFGDFLIFRYLGNCVFSIKIFGKNGFIKKFTKIANHRAPHVNIKDDASRIETRVNVDHFVPVTNIKDESDFDQTETNPTEFSCQNRSIVVSKRCAGRPKKVFGKFNGSPSKSKVPNYDYPLYEFTVGRWSLYNVHIPMRIFNANNIRMGPKLVVEDQRGKQWPVKFYDRDTRITLATGWAECRASNNIKEDDKCVLELVVDRSNVCRKMNVRRIGNEQSAPRSDHKDAPRSDYKYALRNRVV